MQLDNSIIVATEQFVEGCVASVSSNEQLVLAAENLKGIKEKYKEIEEMRKSMTIPLDASKKAIMDFFRKPLSLLENAEGKLKATILNFQCEQQRLAEIAQEKLRIAALKKEEETRRKLADLADAQELKGNVVTAEALRAQAMEVSVEVPIVLADVQKIAGISTRETWSFEVVDPCIVPRQFLIVDEKSLGKIAIATKGTFPVSGVRFFSKQSMSVGTNHG